MKFLIPALFLALTACNDKSPGNSQPPQATPTAPPQKSADPAPATNAAALPELKMPEAVLGKWRKQGGKGWHVFESETLHYWTDGQKRIDHRISLREKEGQWFIHWMDLERPAERIELSVKDGRTVMKTIPTTRTGPVVPFLGGFGDETFVKES